MPELAWHFLPDDGLTTAYSGSLPRTKVVPGLTLTHDGPLIPCTSGLHASRRVLDALEYAPGSIVCRVEIGGETVEQEDKLVAHTRTVLWMGDATPVIERWLCACLERMLTVARESNCEVSQEEWDAIAVQQRWLAGNATLEEVIVARDSASASASASARARAWARASARDSASASARARAWARASAWDSAWASAWASARASARASASASAWASARAWASEREWQNVELERMLDEAFASASVPAA